MSLTLASMEQALSECRLYSSLRFQQAQHSESAGYTQVRAIDGTRSLLTDECHKANGRSCLTVAAFARTRALTRHPALWRVQLRGNYLLPFALL